MKPRVLKMVGDFQQLGYASERSLADARGKRTAPGKAEVVAYLQAGTAYTLSPGLVPDTFDPTSTAGKASILTDGEYAWPQMLAYYVERYDVEVDAAFEEHLRRRGWRPPAAVDVTTVMLPWESDVPA